MIKKYKYVIIFSFFIVAGFIMISFSLPAHSKSSFSYDSVAKPTTNEHFQETKDFFLSETEGGQTKWEIRAKSAEFKSEGLVLLNKVKINLYEDGVEFLNIQADAGRFDNINKNVHLEGNIIGITNRGESFATQTLDWFSAEKKIITSDNVKITGQNLIVKAKGLEIFPELKKIILKKNIKAEFYGGNKTLPLEFGR